jgi:hypothetical protein
MPKPGRNGKSKTSPMPRKHGDGVMSGLMALNTTIQTTSVTDHKNVENVFYEKRNADLSSFIVNMTTLTVRGNMASTKKRSAKKFTKKKSTHLHDAERSDWQKWGAKLILGTMFTVFIGVVSAGRKQIGSHAEKLAAYEVVHTAQNQRIQAIEERAEDQGKKTDRIHWFLIERNKVQVPAALK